MAALHVLVSNDDGLLAPGLLALFDVFVNAGHRVTAVAPSGERSASSHAISIWKPLDGVQHELRPGLKGWAVDGTPADCVKLALFGLLRDDPPDVVVSGVNPGINVGDAIFYSGTVGAAAEAAMVGHQAIAVSISARYGEPRDFRAAANMALALAEKVAKPGCGKYARREGEVRDLNAVGALPPRTLLNINAPNLAPDKVRGVVSTLHGVSAFLDNMVPFAPPDRPDTPPGTHTWRNEGKSMRMTPADGDWDDRVVEQGFISVTPIRLEVNDKAMSAQVQHWLNEIAPGKVRHAAHLPAEATPSVEAWSPFPVEKPAPVWNEQDAQDAARIDATAK